MKNSTFRIFSTIGRVATASVIVGVLSIAYSAKAEEKQHGTEEHPQEAAAQAEHTAEEKPKDASAAEDHPAADGHSAEKGHSAESAESAEPAQVPGQGASGSSRYCANIADEAADARFAWQAETLMSLKKEIDDKIVALEAKRAEYEEWLKKRNEALDQVESGIVSIYAKMRPDAASEQLSAMEIPAAAAILRKLNARIASAILNEMDPEHAAQVAKAMSEVPQDKPDDQT